MGSDEICYWQRFHFRSSRLYGVGKPSGFLTVLLKLKTWKIKIRQGKFLEIIYKQTKNLIQQERVFPNIIPMPKAGPRHMRARQLPSSPPAGRGGIAHVN